MSGEKTEEPTFTKLQDLRKKGDVPRSADFCCAAIFAVAVAVTASRAPSLGTDFARVWNGALGAIPEVGRGALPESVAAVGIGALGVLVVAMMVPLAVLMLAAGMSSYLQVGPVFSIEPLVPKLEKLSPAKNLTQLFSPTNLWEVVRSILKIGLGVSVCYMIIRTQLPLIERLALAEVAGAAVLAGVLVWDLALALLLVAVAVGMFDLFYQRFAWLKRNRMSKEEVKREYENQEGKPEVKQERRRIMQEMSVAEQCNRIGEEGTVLVRNPTRIAIVLKYTGKGAPIVVARGTGEVARRMIRIARKNDLPEQHDRKLARELLKLKPKQQIPKQLYDAVGELFLWAGEQMREQGRIPPWEKGEQPE